jgi:hypothetical protein
MRYEHTSRAAVEYREDRIGPRHAGSHQHDIAGRAIERRVLLIDHDEVVADLAQDLGRVARQVFKNVPTSLSLASILCRKEEAAFISVILCRLRFGRRSRHRIVVGVENPARLLREIKPWRTEDVDELVEPTAASFRGVNGRRRDDCDGRALA